MPEREWGPTAKVVSELDGLSIETLVARGTRIAIECTNCRRLTIWGSADLRRRLWAIRNETFKQIAPRLKCRCRSKIVWVWPARSKDVARDGGKPAISRVEIEGDGARR